MSKSELERPSYYLFSKSYVISYLEEYLMRDISHQYVEVILTGLEHQRMLKVISWKTFIV